MMRLDRGATVDELRHESAQLKEGVQLMALWRALCRRRNMGEL